MPALVDLHLHTTASDGRLAPEDLVKLLVERGVRVAAITDHDSTEGLEAAVLEARRHAELELIYGVELGAVLPDPDGDVHMLGYFLNIDDPSFQSALITFREGRVERARGMVQNLVRLGFEIEWERVIELAQGGAIARPHIAWALVEKGYFQSIQEAFDQCLGDEGIAYVDRTKLTTDKAIDMIRSAGGVAVLAHPARYVSNLETHLPALKRSGLAGMEVYYKDYNIEEVSWLQRLCYQYDLVPCGGSDYHAMETPDEMLPGTVGPPMASITRLKSLVS
jgi:predicted metal-dependent phosphoesterase TrpH